MAVEVYKNGVTTTLNGSINNSVTSLVVTSATGFPTSGNFRIIVESELMIVTAISGTTFTVTRGAEGTTAASHASSVSITNILTAGAIDGIIGRIGNGGALSAVPAANLLGLTYYVNNAPYLIRDNGSNLEYYGPIWKMTPPVLGNFAWINQSSATANNTNGTLVMIENTATNNAESVRLLKKAAPSTPYTITIAYNMTNHYLADAFNAGIMIRESSSGKVLGHGHIRRTNIVKQSIYKWTNPTTFSSTVNEDNTAEPGFNGLFWVRLTDDGTNRIYYTSSDGFNWVAQKSEGRTTFLTADEVGIYINVPTTTNIANQANAATFFHYLET